MRFHPKGLLVAAAFAALVMLAVDVRWGIAAIAAGIVIDWLFLAFRSVLVAVEGRVV